MPKKKGSKKLINAVADVTLNDSANAQKPVSRLKKSENDKPREIPWDGFQDDDFDIVEEVNADGTKNFVYKKKKKCSKPQTDNIDERPGIVYPEFIWYFVSRYLIPEQISTFALLCKDTYAITRTERFWRNLYERYCKNQRNLPQKLKIENDHKAYGLRQRVIRALYHTYYPFILKLTMMSFKDTTPHMLVKRRCVNVWYNKGPCKWFIYFKLKRLSPLERPASPANFIEELGRIDANPDDETKLLKVACERFQDVPPVMGMILSTVTMGLTQGFRYNRLLLGFNTSHHTSRDIQPDCSVVLDTASSITVYDWWHPMYPHFDDDALPSCDRDEDASPVLEGDFFGIDGDM